MWNDPLSKGIFQTFDHAYRKSNPGILMVQSAQDRTTDNATGCLGDA